MIKLLLIDGHAICHRAYHAIPKKLTSQGRPINAVYGFFSMLLKAIDELKPTHLAICFDLPYPTFRHLKFLGYQAKRPKTEEDFKDQIQMVQNTLAKIKFPTFSLKGYEADDVIGTIAKKITENRKSEAIIVTADRDLTQLIDKKIKLFVPGMGPSEAKVFDEKEVKETIGVLPDQIVDYKALVGDSSDNYPGVSGIGPKTAASLLNKFHNLERIYHSLAKIDPKVSQKLERDRESAVLSQELAKINDKTPISFKLEGMVWDERRKETLAEGLKKLGFKSLLGRVRRKEENKKDKKEEKERQMKLI